MVHKKNANVVLNIDIAAKKSLPLCKLIICKMCKNSKFIRFVNTNPYFQVKYNV